MMYMFCAIRQRYEMDKVYIPLVKLYVYKVYIP